ncbi:uncharacterized protein [Asterias amurensis]|uniref:uncharacterized protein isoform X6 n=1 Tax=Asterias amurensis TaxID=7602 RepID=UPI003AB2873F
MISITQTSHCMYMVWYFNLALFYEISKCIISSYSYFSMANAKWCIICDRQIKATKYMSLDFASATLKREPTFLDFLGDVVGEEIDIYAPHMSQYMCGPCHLMVMKCIKVKTLQETISYKFHKTTAKHILSTSSETLLNHGANTALIPPPCNPPEVDLLRAKVAKRKALESPRTPLPRKMSAHVNECFPKLNDAELEGIVDSKDGPATKKSVRNAVDTLKTYCHAKHLDISAVEEYSLPELSSFLRKFYAEVRTAKGNFYAKNSMEVWRFGLQRHFLKLRQIDIVKNKAFNDANLMFNSMMIKLLKHEGKVAVTHKEPIHSEDMEKIQNSEALDQHTPLGLQNKVFIDIMLHMCNRGRENLCEMGKDDFEIKTDATNNQRYVCRTRDRLTKNHRTGDESYEGRMYETSDNPQRCPVLSFEKYVSFLNPNCEAFWQHPKKLFLIDSNVWYDNMPLGKNKLFNKMNDISLQAKCSTHYTNRCLRATGVTVLDSAGCEARHIMSVSGRRSETSIRSYSKTGEDEKRKTSQILSANTSQTIATSLHGSAIATDRDHQPSTSSGSTIIDSDTHVKLPQSPQLQLLSNSQEEAILNDLTNSPNFGQSLNIGISRQGELVQTSSNLRFHNCQDDQQDYGNSVESFNVKIENSVSHETGDQQDYGKSVESFNVKIENSVSHETDDQQDYGQSVESFNVKIENFANHETDDQQDSGKSVESFNVKIENSVSHETHEGRPKTVKKDKCAAFGCSHKKSKSRCAFYSFPRYSKANQKWIKASRCNLSKDGFTKKKNFSSRNLRLCECHFARVPYPRTSSQRLKNIVPTLFNFLAADFKASSKPVKRVKRIPIMSAKPLEKPTSPENNCRPSFYQQMKHFLSKEAYNAVDSCAPSFWKNYHQLEKEVMTLKATCNSTKVLSLQNIKCNDSVFETYTGLPNYATFEVLCGYMAMNASCLWRFKALPFGEFTFIDTINVNRQTLTIEDQLFLFLVAVRTGSSSKDLAIRFSISERLVNNIISSWAVFVSDTLEKFYNTTVTKKAKFNVAVDYTALFSESPALLTTQQNETIISRRLIAVGFSRYGVVTSVLSTKRGHAFARVSTTHNESTDSASKQPSSLGPVKHEQGTKILPNSSQPGDVSSLVITEDLSKSHMTPMSTAEVFHVERALNRIKQFHYLQKQVEPSMEDMYEQVFKACAFLVNFQSVS